MPKLFRNKKFVPLLLAGFAIATVPVFAQQMHMEGPAPTTALITVRSKSGAPLDPARLRLQVNRHDTPITSVTPLKPSATQVAILIDDGLRISFGNKVSDVGDFINQLSPGTKVLVGYMQNGTVRGNPSFSADHKAVISELRIPMSVGGVDSSPYFCLSDFVKHWPSNQPGARIVLMITNGIDPYNGSTSILNQDSPYVQTAVEDAQRAGVAVYSIYYAQSFPMGGRGSFSGQNYLQKLAEATGGDSFFQGTITPPSLAPYLDQFSKAISQSYTIGFRADVSLKKGENLAQLKLTTSQPGVKINAPEEVHPGLDLH